MDLLSAEIYSKETTVGSDKCLILPPRSRFVAALNIPNWRRIRFGFFVSKTTLDEPNGVAPTAKETVSGSTKDWSGIGLLSSPDRAITGAGVFGYSIGSEPTTAVFHNARTVSGGNSFDQNYEMVTRDGAMTSYASVQSRLPIGSRNELDSESALFGSVIAMGIERTGTATKTGYSTVSDVSILSLASHLSEMDPPNHDFGTTAYHEEETPYLIFQWPFRNSRLRIHAWRVEVLETLENGG